MLYNMSLTLARRVVLFPVVSRPILTRSIVSTPHVAFPARSATTKSTKSTTKTAAKPKSAGSKPKKATKKEKKVTFPRKDLVVPPKPAMTPFIVFSVEERTQLPKPGSLQIAQVQAKEIGQKWKTLGEEEKKVYEARAAEQNKKLAKEFNEWLANIDSKVFNEINKRRKAAGKPKIIRPREGPKPPVPAFFQFLVKFKIDNPSLPTQEASKQGGAAWRTLSPEEKQPYVDSAEADKRAYLLERGAYDAAQQSV